MKLHANGIQFNVVDEGAGPVILLLHGFPDSSRLWKHLVSLLVRHVHVENVIIDGC